MTEPAYRVADEIRANTDAEDETSEDIIYLRRRVKEEKVRADYAWRNTRAINRALGELKGGVE